MKEASVGLNRHSVSTTDCFREPIKAGYVKPELESLSASINLSSFRFAGPPALVWLAIRYIRICH